jgi:hypothetical protein
VVWMMLQLVPRARKVKWPPGGITPERD